MKKLVQIMVVVGFAAGQAFGALTLPVNQDFQTPAVGTSVNGNIAGWGATTSEVKIATSPTPGNPDSKSVILPEGSTLTNAVTPTGNKVWTDFYIRPVLGEPPAVAAPSQTAVLLYFTTNGYIAIEDAATNFYLCVTNVLENALSGGQQIVSGEWARVTLCTDYDTKQMAVFLDGVLLRQQMAFTRTDAATFKKFACSNLSETAYIDNVNIQTSPTGLGLTGNLNNKNGADVDEIQANGFIALVRHVGGVGADGPEYANLTAAFAAANEGDTIYVHGGTYAESFAIVDDVTIIGDDFTNNGTITVSASVIVSNLNLEVNTPIVVSDAGDSITFSTGGMKDNHLELTGTFTLYETWGGWPVFRASTLPFTDTFEMYAVNTKLADLGYWGWNATTSVHVQADETWTGASTKAVIVPEGTMLSNTVVGAGHNKVWTDFYMKPTLGEPPTNAAGSSVSVLMYFGTNGYPYLAKSPNGWELCDTLLSGSLATPVSAWARVTIFNNYTDGKMALFLDKKLVKQDFPFRGNAASVYGAFAASNVSETAYLDDVRITVDGPPTENWAFTDDDGDGMDDRQELDSYGSTLFWPPAGAAFKFR